MSANLASRNAVHDDLLAAATVLQR